VGAQGERNAGARAGGAEQLGTKLLGEEAVRLALVDEQFGQAGAVLDQRDGVVATPGCAVGPQIAPQRFLAPGDLARRDDRGEGGDASVSAGMAQGEGERAVSAHRMAGDPLRAQVRGEDAGDQARQLGGEVALHAVVAGVGLAVASR
jgi:hypothetical protein